MPFFQGNDSDYSMSEDEMRPEEVVRTPSPPIPQDSLASKADLMSGAADDLSMHGFENESEDSDTEVFKASARLESSELRGLGEPFAGADESLPISPITSIS